MPRQSWEEMNEMECEGEGEWNVVTEIMVEAAERYVEGW